jgi:hypothetical protein
MMTGGWRSVVAFGALAGALLVSSCGRSPLSPTPDAGEVLVLRFQTEHFHLYGDRVTDAVLRGVADQLESNFSRVLADLSIAAVEPVRVKIWQDQTSWNAAARAYFGRTVNVSGYITGPDEVRVLHGTNVARNAVHEFCHTVSLHVNPAFGNNPRWLWESVALYENGELVDPRTLDYMVRGAPPTLDQLNADVSASQQVYEVGYLIGEFVVTRFGPPALVQLIRANGNTAAVLGLSPDQFRDAWYAFVRERYLS